MFRKNEERGVGGGGGWGMKESDRLFAKAA